MSSAQAHNATINSEVMLRLMDHVEHNPEVSQRALAGELGIAMGLVNSYIKRAINKGWMKAKQIPAKRYAYYITPYGFAEKSQLAARYLTSSFSFFRAARGQCIDLFDICKTKGWSKVALVGSGELADIAELIAQQSGIEMTRVDDLPSGNFDAVMVTDIQHPQATYDELLNHWPEHHILTPALLYISRDRQQEK